MDFRRIDAIHRIMIIDDSSLPDPLPSIIEENIRSARKFHPDAKITLWNKVEIRNFIESRFSGDVLAAYDALKPYAYKCDLARYCLLHELGGLYLDLAVRCTAELHIPNGKSLLAFRDLEDLASPSWTIMNQAFLWAQPGHEALKLAIDMIVGNCKTRYYGINPLYPTGPVLFGRALIAAMAGHGQSDQADDQWIGRRVSMTGDVRSKITGYVAPDYETVGISMKHIGGDLHHIGLTGTNNYNDFWWSQDIYDVSKI